mmetsp:Transcript_4736/g.7063  ORF Transcript_4736/g.7063 Transcript_4736/m.7063 type:complete len:235 (-) Transcript_4736:25-729(-)
MFSLKIVPTICSSLGSPSLDFCSFCFHLCYLHLSGPVPVHVLQLVHLLLLRDVVLHLRQLGEVGLLLHEPLLLLLLLGNLPGHHLVVRPDLLQLLRPRRYLLVQPLRLRHQLVQLVLQRVQRLHGLPRGHLELEQLLVALLDLGHVLLVLNLQLVEVDVVQHVAHLLLLAELAVYLVDLALESGVLELQLLNQGVPLAQLVLHVAHHLFCYSSSSSHVLSSHNNVTLELICITL